AVAAAAAREAVDHAALAVGRFLEVLDAAVDDFLGNHDAGIASRANGLHLRDGHGAFVEVAAVHRRDVTPTTAIGLGLAAICYRARQNALQLAANRVVLFFSVHGGQEKQSIPVAVHVATGFHPAGIAEQSVRLAPRHEPVAGLANVVGVLAFARRAPLG